MPCPDARPRWFNGNGVTGSADQSSRDPAVVQICADDPTHVFVFLCWVCLAENCALVLCQP
jgi:hypothetical protein